VVLYVHHAEDEFLVGEGEREAFVLGAAFGRAEGPAVNVGDGGRRPEVFGTVVGQAHIHAERESLLDEVGCVTNDAPADRLVLGVDIGRGRKGPRRGEGIDLIGRRDAHWRAGVVERELVLPPADEADQFAVEEVALPNRGIALGLVQRARGVRVELVEAAVGSDDRDGRASAPRCWCGCRRATRCQWSAGRGAPSSP